MNRKTILTLGISGAMLLSVGAAAATMFNINLNKMFSSLGDDEYSLVFSNTSNKLDSTRSESLVKLGQGNNRTITYSGYSLVNDKWGSLADGGYFTNDGEVTNRIGGLYSVSYHIDGELILYYGYLEHGKPAYYNLTLDPSEDLVTFDSTLGYPDVFKVANEGESSVEILDMQFSYSCSQQDLHHHTGADTIVCHEVNNELVYEHQCDICELYYDPVDVSMYKIRLGTGTDSTGEVEYNPYSVRDYNTLGSLSFDANNNEFVLEMSGDHSTQNLWVNANTEGSSTYTPRLVVRSSNNASIQNVTQRGGYGILIFEGELTFVNGKFETEADINTVRGNLNFNDTDKSDTAISLLNGQLYVENNARVTVDGYSLAIAMLGNATKGGIWFTNGALDIKNCTQGIVSNITREWSSAEHGEYIRLNCETSIVTNENSIRMTDGTIKSDEFLLDSDNTYYFESTDSGKTTLSVTNIKFGSSQHNPNITVKTNGGTAISDSALTDSITLDFAGGTTTIVDSNNDSSTSTGIKNVNSENEIKIRNNATLNINNFKYGITCAEAVSTINLTSTLKISNCYGGIKETTINVGTNEVEGHLLIDVPANKGTSSDDRSYGIKNNQFESVNCVKGTAAIYSSSLGTYTSGIVLVDGFASGRITVNENCKLGFKNIDYALQNQSDAAIYNTFDITINILGSDDYNRTVGDSAWYCANKPTINYIGTEQEFNTIFGIQ